MSCIIDDLKKQIEGMMSADRADGYPDHKVLLARAEGLRSLVKNSVSPADRKRPTFDKLPFYEEGQKTMTYAGIGSRETPIEVQKQMYAVAKELEKRGYTLQSGDAPGADKAFAGAPQPWYKEDGTVAGTKEFTSSKSPVVQKTGWAAYGSGRNVANSNIEVFKSVKEDDNRAVAHQVRAIAKEIHPMGKALGEKQGLGLHARNTFQIFGADLDTPVDFVLYYAEEGLDPIRPSGGTGQAVEMANRKGIPTINMWNNPDWKKQLNEVLKSKSESKPTKAETYEVSSAGDKDFSALYARLNDGRTVEEAYQLDVKGYRAKGNDWRLGKGKPPLDKSVDTKAEYRKLWEQYLSENRDKFVKIKSIVNSGKVLTDKFAAKGSVNQADALMDIVKSGWEPEASTVVDAVANNIVKGSPSYKQQSDIIKEKIKC